MEKSNKMENQDILTAYSNYVTENNERPHSIASFSKLIDPFLNLSFLNFLEILFNKIN